MATLYVDFENGNDANDGLSFANRKKSITSASTASSPGDTVRVMASQTPVSIGSATWTNLSPTVTVSSSLTQLLYKEGAWSAATNVTATASTTRRLGATAASLAIAAAFTTGRVGHYDLGSTQDLSAFDSISMYLRITTAQTDLSIYEIRLCSDAGGTTAVKTLTLPAINSITNNWFPITLSDGSALPSNVRSIALYANTDPVTPTIIIENVIACNRNSLNLTCLLHKSTDGISDCWGIKSIEGTDVILDTNSQSLATVTPRGYVGTTESVTTYATQPIELNIAGVTSATGDFFTIGVSGSSGNDITFSGGWNRTDMSTQTGITWATGTHGNGEFIGCSNRSHIIFERLGGKYFNKVIAVASANRIIIDDCHSVHFIADGFLLATGTNTSPAVLIQNCTAKQSSTTGFTFSAASGSKGMQAINCYATNCFTDGFSVGTNVSTLEDCSSHNNTSDGFFLTATDGSLFENCAANDNGATGFNFVTASQNRLVDCEARRNLRGADMSQSQSNTFINFETEDNTTGSINSLSSSNVDNFFFNWVHNEATTIVSPIANENAKFISVNDNGTANNHIIYTDGGQISSDTTTRHTASGISWKMDVTNTGRNELYPLIHRLPAIACKANIEVTAKIWLRKNNNTIAGSFVLRRGQLAGLTTTHISTMSNVADTWEEQTITFTPTSDGFVEFEVWAYGGTTLSVYWDDFSYTASEKLDTSSGDYAFLRTGVMIGDDGQSGGGGSGEPFANGYMS
jgi:hypothetical protein